MCLYLQKMGLDSEGSPEEMYLFPPLAWSPSLCEYLAVKGKPVSYSQALSAFKSMLSFSKLNPRLYGLHSPRQGGTTEAFVNDVLSFVIDLQGRLRSESSKYCYIELSETEICQKLGDCASYWYFCGASALCYFFKYLLFDWLPGALAGSVCFNVPLPYFAGLLSQPGLLPYLFLLFYYSCSCSTGPYQIEMILINKYYTVLCLFIPLIRRE